MTVVGSSLRSQKGGASRMPGPRGLQLLGAMPSFLRDPLGYFERAGKTYGPIFELPIGLRRYVFVNNAELAEAVLGREFDSFNMSSTSVEATDPLLGRSIPTTTDPVYWEQLHKRMLPMFTPKMMQNYFERTVDAIYDELDAMDAYASSAQPIGLHRAIRHGMFVALTRTLFARGMTEDEIPLLLDQLSSATTYIAARYLTNSSPLILAIPVVRRGKRDLAKVQARATEVVRARRRDVSQESRDMLDVLIGTADETAGALSDEQVRENTVALWFGGQETTPTVTTWAFGLLASHPHIRDRVLAEVDEVLGDCRPTFADLERLPYTNGVLDEAMRLYPPFVFLGREALKDVDLGGYGIRQGQQIGFVGWTIHREAANWPEPDRFDPERHTPDERKKRGRCAFLAFGYGKRRCLGARIGRMESTLMLAMTAQRFILDHADGQLPKPKAGQSIQPSNGMPMLVRRR